MGQEVHRQGLIKRSTLDGTRVGIEMDGDDFSMAMLEMHLQMSYDSARLVERDTAVWRDRISTRIVIDFGNMEDAMHFHLRQQTGT